MKDNPPDKTGNLEIRIKQLTDNLIEKQSQLEVLSSEKNSMTHKIEYLERKVSESLGTIRSRKIEVFDDNLLEVDRRPSFLQESPFDGAAARKVKRAYSEIDKLSIRIGA